MKQQIKSVEEEKTKFHEQLQTAQASAAQVIVDMVDSEGETSSSKCLVERLEEAPKKFWLHDGNLQELSYTYAWDCKVLLASA